MSNGVVYSILMVLYILDLIFKVSYPIVEPYLSWTSDEWYAGMAIFMSGAAMLTEQYHLIGLPRGVVTRDGILLIKKNAVIPFQNIEKINMDDKGIAVLQTAAGETEVLIDEWDMVKLPRAGFTSWSIDKKSAVIARGPAEAELYAEYSPTGKYANKHFSLILAFAAAVCMFILLCIQVVGLGAFMVSLPLVFSFVFIIDYHKEVVVTIEHNGIKLKDEHLVEHFMSFAEIYTVEKGRMRTKLTAKDGRVMHLPRTLYLLPEFIEEYAKPGKT